ncbi:hypothetical protein ACFQY7_45020 [Actinomadura luteofluorescens]|uniref:hypothetical protein n=1 Tax=Actinomadura luteofluorescens TaxID=46163 RepID=UPI0036415651
MAALTALVRAARPKDTGPGTEVDRRRVLLTGAGVIGVAAAAVYPGGHCCAAATSPPSGRTCGCLARRVRRARCPRERRCGRRG